MAKSKRSAALFEVIQSSRLPKRQNPLFSVRRWFGRRIDKPIPFQASLPASDQQSLPDPIPDLRTHTVEAPEMPPQSTPKQPIPGVDLQLDPDRQQITFKVSYNSAIVTGFTVLVTIGLAYLA